jgi:alpha-glucosidase (family GH31 glycosyl hydrolase)
MKLWKHLTKIGSLSDHLFFKLSTKILSMIRFIILTISALATYACSFNTNRDFINFKDHTTFFEVEASDGKYIFQYYNPEIVEVHFIPNGEELIDSSYAVVMEISDHQIAQSHESWNKITIDSKGIDIKIKKYPFSIEFFNDGKPVIKEKAGYAIDSLETLEFKITHDEALYGAGSRALGMNRRGHRLPLYNKAQYGYSTYSKQLNYSLPIIISSNKYLLHFDNAPIGFLDLDSQGNNTVKYETISGRKTYQLVVGDNWYDVVDNYTQLTGRHAMLPRWALGNYSSRFGYHSQDEVLETIQKFKEHEIPVDAVIIDLYWFGKDIKHTLGNLAFYEDSFPNPDKMIRELRDKNIETILITEPFVMKTSNRWEEALEQEILAVDSTGEVATFNFYFGDGAIIDVYSSKGYRWFSDINKGLIEQGITGIWGDLGEPEAHPSYVIHASGTADEVHNTYGHDWARLVYNSFLEYNPNTRPFILMRAGAAGSQRYGLIPWSGDVSRSWDGLSRQVEIALQMGMQGLAYMHSDLGGFLPAEPDGELYARWMQYGVFQPIYRPHADEALPSEPVFWDDTTKALAKKAIELRYKMLPYNYNLAWQNTQSGEPLMRPLFFEEPENTALFDYDTAYLWGNDFLVAPIMKPGVTTKEVYLPKTSDWFDFYTRERYKGGQTISVKVNMKSIPTFVRAGSIIPMAKSLQTTKEYDGNSLEIHYYYDDKNDDKEFILYNDDGLTQDAFLKQKFELLKFKIENDESTISILFSADTGTNFKANEKNIELVIHNLKETLSQVRVSGSESSMIVDSVENRITIPFIWNTDTPEKVTLKF